MNCNPKLCSSDEKQRAGAATATLERLAAWKERWRERDRESREKVERNRNDRGKNEEEDSLVSWLGREGVEDERMQAAGRADVEMEELEKWKSTVGRGGDRRNTYPVSFTLWLQLIWNRLSFERFSIDRLRRVARKEGRRHLPCCITRNRKRDRERKRGGEKKGERERKRKSLACGRTYSKPTPIASRFLRPLVSTCLYGRPTIFFRLHPSVSSQDATLIFRRLAWISSPSLHTIHCHSTTIYFLATLLLQFIAISS